MKTEDKEKRLKTLIDKMTDDELKALTAEAFIDGIEKGMKLQELKEQTKNLEETA